MTIFDEIKRETKVAVRGYFAPLTWLWNKLRRLIKRQGDLK